MKRWSWLVALLLVMAMLAGCTPKAPDVPPAEEPGEQQPEKTEEPEAPEEPTPAAPAEQTVLLYLPDDAAQGCETEEVRMVLSPQGILDALTERKVLPAGVVVNAFYLEQDEDGMEAHAAEDGDSLHIVMDLSEDFAQAVTGAGSAGELMLLGSLTNTMLTAYSAEDLTLTCGGEVLETGHNVYDLPLTFFDAAE